MPASVTTRTSSPVAQGLEQLRHPARLVGVEERDDPAGRRHAQVGAEPAQPAGVLGRDHRRGRRAPRAAGPTRRPGGPAASPPAAPVRLAASTPEPLAAAPYYRRVTATLEAPADTPVAGRPLAGRAAGARPPRPRRARALARPAPAARLAGAARASPLLAGFTRFWALGFPPGKNASQERDELRRGLLRAPRRRRSLRYGYEDNRGYMFIVHPPLGKWLIAASSGCRARSPAALGQRVPDELARLADRARPSSASSA